MAFGCGRQYGAWWKRYPSERIESARLLLLTERDTIDRFAESWEYRLAGEVDWYMVFWDAAYRAAFSFSPGKQSFRAYLFRNMERKISDTLRTHYRRNHRLNKFSLYGKKLDQVVFSGKINDVFTPISEE